MPIHLITGPHQSGKTRRLWQRLRAEPLGAAVLVRPVGGLPRDLVQQVHGWSGPGLLPPCLGLADLVDLAAGSVGQARRVLGLGAATHLLRTWARDRLAGTPWAGLAAYRATGRELADLDLRLDDHLISAADLEVAGLALNRAGDRSLAGVLPTQGVRGTQSPAEKVEPPGQADNGTYWFRLVRAVTAARRHLAKAAAKHGLATAGERLRAVAAAGPALPYRAVYLDDFLSFTPAELALLRALARDRLLVFTAVDDLRLGEDSPARRLAAAFPEAEEEPCSAPSGRPAELQAVLTHALEDDHPLPGGIVAAYHYRDPIHAGRAIAAWLTREAMAPGAAIIYLRAMDAEGLALADALAAAGVPVRGEFQVPLLATAPGGLIAALADFCRAPVWSAFLGVCERLGLVVPTIPPPPLRLADLIGPWAGLPHGEALARLRRLDGKTVDDWGWNERDDDRPRLRAALTWLEARRDELAVPGDWRARFAALMLKFDPGGDVAGIMRELDLLAGLAPVGAEELDELLAAATVTVTRASDADPHACLVIADVVRGRTWPRPVAILHGLEHGRWPRAPVAGSLLGEEDRRRLAGALGRDVFDEAGRKAGEIGAFLAAMARAERRILVGIPCGEREPSAWLSALAEQLGWDMEEERTRATAEAVPGAPLGPDDSQGQHEQALWQSVGQPDFTFRVPPAAPADLGLHPSNLNDVAADSFALVCDRLDLRPSLEDRTRLDQGTDLHGILAQLAPHPTAQWSAKLEPLLDQWIAAAADAVEKAERGRFARRVRVVVEAEVEKMPQGARSEAEVKLAVPLAIPGHGTLELNGKIDRLDRLADGTVRIIDYKLGSVARLSDLVKAGSEGQLLAYAAGVEARGEHLAEAYYRGLGDQRRVVCLEAKRKGEAIDVGKVIAQRLENLSKAIVRLASGDAQASVDGATFQRGYAPIARLDEARLDLGRGDEEDGP